MPGPDIKSILSDIQASLSFREDCDVCASYYDADGQVSEEDRKTAKLFNRPVTVGNLVKPAINAMLGNEARQRVGWMVAADDDEIDGEVAEALNAEFSDIIRLTDVDYAISEAYASQCKAGLGWVEVENNPDKLGQPYLVSEVHRDEVYWDMRSAKPDLSDAEWIARRRFMSPDWAKRILPEAEKIIDAVAGGWEDYQIGGMAAGDTGAAVSVADASAPDMEKERDVWYSVSRDHVEKLIQTDRKRIAVYRVMYRTIDTATVIETPEGRYEAFDLEDENHVELAVAEPWRVSKTKTTKIRQKWFVGPHEVRDEPSPYPHNYFNLVPFFGYRTDRTRTPRPPVYDMIGPQDNYNAAGREILHILKNRRIYAAEGATDMTDEELQDETYRRDGVIRGKEGKQWGSDIVVEREWAELDRLINMQDRYEHQIRAFTGIYHTFGGQQEGSQKSGVAIANLSELASNSLAELNANYSYGRLQVGRLLLAMEVHRRGKQTRRVRVNAGPGLPAKTLYLNKPGDNGLINDVRRARCHLVLRDIASSSGYRQQQHQQYADLYQASAPTVQEFLLPLILDTSDVPNKDIWLESWRQKYGPAGSPEEAQQARAQQAQAMQEEREIELDSKKASAERDRALAQKYLSEAGAAQAKGAYDVQRGQTEAATRGGPEKSDIEAARQRVEEIRMRQQEEENSAAAESRRLAQAALGAARASQL